MKIAKAVKKLLDDAGAKDVYVAPPSIATCAEPICVGRAEYERDTKLAGGDRGSAHVWVRVCRETDEAAQDAAFACEKMLRDATWERVRDVKGGQIRGCSVEPPAFKERDDSGRYVYEVALELTIKRDAD